MSETVLRTIELTKRYKNRLAVDHLNIEVRRGDIFGFLGPNGAGKSTTIRMILHLVFPSDGDVEIFGASMKKAGHKALVFLRTFAGLVNRALHIAKLGGKIIRPLNNRFNPNRL